MTVAQTKKPDNKWIVEVSDKAIVELKRSMEQENKGHLAVRLGVQGGGCSGLSYKLDYDEPKEKDHVIETKGVKVVIDRKSAIYLKGMILDFNDGLNNRGFSFNNPNATNTCGCGESFSI